MPKYVPVIIMICLLMVQVSALAATPDLEAYAQAVSEYFKVDVAQVKEAASYLPRTDELPALYIVALKAGTDPVAVAKERNDGAKWQAILAEHGLGSDLFHIQVRGFVPSAVFQPILDKFSEDDPASWKSAPLTDGDVRDLANLKFISDLYGYSMYRVMAMRDKGRSYPQIQSQVWEIAQGPEGKQKTATAGF